MKIKKIIKKIKNSLLVKSFKKIDKNIFYIVMYDLLMFILLFTGSFFSSKIIEKKSKVIEAVDFTNLLQKTAEEINKNTAILKGFLITFLIITFAYIIYSLIVFSFFQGKILSIVVKKKFTKTFFKKFLSLNFILALTTSVLFLLILELFKPQVAVILATLLIILLIYFIPLLLITFAKGQKVKKAFHIAFKTPRFIITYINALIVLLITGMLSLIFKPLEDNIEFSLTLLIFLFYLAWFRYYLSLSIDKVKG